MALSVVDQVARYRANLSGRYRPYEMYQYCTRCGVERHRTAFRMVRYTTLDKGARPHTSLVCKYCLGKKPPPQMAPTPWISYEDFERRLRELRGTSEYKQFGVTHTYEHRSTIAHRQALAVAGKVAWLKRK